MQNSKVFAYLRVSSDSQNINRQDFAIKEYCKNNNIIIKDEDIFTDYFSGKDFSRPAYEILRRCIRSGDTLIVKELDRLGRNKLEVKEELQFFKKNNIRIKILDIPTTLIDLPKEQSWIFDMINNILIEVMASVAEEERVKIKQRQREGIEAARQNGGNLGRPKIKLPNNFSEVYNSWKAGNITAIEAANVLGLKKRTFYIKVKEFEQAKL